MSKKKTKFSRNCPQCNKIIYYNSKIGANKKTVGQIWERDRQKIEVFTQLGYITIIVWECDVNTKLLNILKTSS